MLLTVLWASAVKVWFNTDDLRILWDLLLSLVLSPFKMFKVSLAYLSVFFRCYMRTLNGFGIETSNRRAKEKNL